MAEKNVGKKARPDILGTAFPRTAINRLLIKYRVNKTTELQVQASKQLASAMEEICGWIINEAEKIAIGRGSHKVSMEDVKIATLLFFGGDINAR